MKKIYLFLIKNAALSFILFFFSQLGLHFSTKIEDPLWQIIIAMGSAFIAVITIMGGSTGMILQNNMSKLTPKEQEKEWKRLEEKILSGTKLTEAQVSAAYSTGFFFYSQKTLDSRSDNHITVSP